MTDRRGGNEEADRYARTPLRTAGAMTAPTVPVRPNGGAVDPYAAQRQAALKSVPIAFVDTVEHQLDRIDAALADELARVDDFNTRMLGPVPSAPSASSASNGTTERSPSATAVRRVGDRLGRVIERLAALQAATTRLSEIG